MALLVRRTGFCARILPSFRGICSSRACLAEETTEQKNAVPVQEEAAVPTQEEAKEFPPIQLAQKSPVLLKRIGKMTNNRSIQDFKRRLCYAKYENERLHYKAACSDRNLPLEIRRYFESRLNSLPRNSSITRIRNRCIITGRGRSVYRKFRMSRICLREMARRGELMGLYKASW